MTTFSRRAIRSLAAAALVATGLVAAFGARPAAAELKKGYTLKPGQKLVIKSDSPLVQGKADLFGGLSPSDCDTPMVLLGSDEFCHSYPITIDASDEVIKSGNLQLNAVLEWAKGVYLPNCPQIGNCGTNEMGVEIWQNPPAQYFPDPGPVGIGECDTIDAQVPANPVKDELFADETFCGQPTAALNTASASSTGFQGTPDTPLSIAHIAAGNCAEQLEPDPDNPVPANGICRIENVGVGNYTGNNPYTLTIELVDYSGTGPVDLSGDTFVPEDLSKVPDATPSDAPSSVAPSQPQGFDVPTFAAPVGVGAPRVDLPGLGSSAGFDGIGPAALGTGDLARRIVDRGPRPLSAADPASGALLLLWLVLLPLSGLGSFLFFLWRRRREDDEPSSPVAA